MTDDMDVMAIEMADAEGYRELRELLDWLPRPGSGVGFGMAGVGRLDPAEMAGAGGMANPSYLSIIGEEGLGALAGAQVGVYPELFIGRSNQLRFPTPYRSAAKTITTSFAQWHAGWQIKYTLLSGTAPSPLTIECLPRSGVTASKRLDGTEMIVKAGGSAAGSIRIDIENTSSYDLSGVGLGSLAFLTAAIRLFTGSGVSATNYNTSTRVKVRVLDDARGGSAIAESTWLPLIDLAELKHLSAGTSDSSGQWRLSIQIEIDKKATAHTFELHWGEPSLAHSATVAPPPYSPIIGHWRPDELIYYGNDDTVARLHIVDGEIWFGPGNAALDVRLYRASPNVLATDSLFDAAELVADRIRLAATDDASLSSTLHAFQIGSTSGNNLILDNNEVIARNNSGTSRLDLQSDGGRVAVGFNANPTTPTDDGILLGQDVLIYRDDPDVLKTDDALRIAHTLAIQSVISPTALSADVNDYDPTGGTTAYHWRLSSDATPRTITGIIGPPHIDGMRLLLSNLNSGTTITIAHQNASSTGVNRIICRGAANFALVATACVELVYDLTTQRWRML